MADMKDARTTNTTELGRMIKQWRTAKNLSQRAAAEAIDILASTISDLENGKRRPDVETLIAVADYFQLPLDQVAVMAGFNHRPSEAQNERLNRLHALIRSVPSADRLTALLEEFSPREIDTLLTVAETIENQRSDSLED